MITVITITCREEGRLVEMAKTLAGNALQSKDVKLQWVIVDEKKTDPRSKAILDAVGGALEVKHLSAPSSEHRQNGLPDHNLMRNTGLAEADGGYVVFLNDCHLVASGWLKAVADAAELGKGIRAKLQSVNDLVVPDDGLLWKLSHWDTWTKVAPKNASGACWGAPKAAFDEIGGFDLAYGGQDKYHDVDACIRLGRVGVDFVTSARAFVVCLRATRDHASVTRSKEAQRGQRNKQLYNKLCLDRTRTKPTQPYAAPIVATPPGVPTTTTEAPPAAAQPAPAPAEVAPPVPAAPDTGDDQGERQAAPPRLGFVGASKISGANKKA
ncbi:MAG: hypothetical protein KJO40_13705 [Deltaproteobacteria bacterium]|nr:hypothetical protein [Deltaproteobacteria bacterium]